MVRLQLRTLFAVVLLCAPCFGAASRIITDHSGVTQTNQPYTYGQVFDEGEIATCPKPKLDGVAATTWQADVRNRWEDGSVRFAIISVNATVNANSSVTVTYQANASCNNTGYLTQAQMLAFDSSGSDAQIVVASNGSTTVTTTLNTMLAHTDPEANTFGDCKNDYWLQGPVVTAVIIQDCTSASAYDFGWSWNGTTMSSPVTGNASTASLHPMFVVYFYPGINAARVDYILDNDWAGRGQDQSYSLTLTIGAAHTTVYTKSTFTHIWQARWRKTFWYGTAPGFSIITPTFAYMKQTLLVPNYDSAQTVSTATNSSSNAATSWSQWSTGDKGEIGGNGGLYAWTQSYGNNSEGAPLQREDLLFLYNEASCTTANSECAKAWQMLTGTSGATDSTLTASNVSGGAGTWNNIGNVPFHMRESRTAATGRQTTTNYFYCSGFDSVDATYNGASCSGSGATNVATGKWLSRHAHSDSTHAGSSIIPIAAVGTKSTGGWTVTDVSHWLDYSYMAYLLTGDYYYMDEEQAAASFAAAATNASNDVTQGMGFMAFMNPTTWISRTWAWGMQVNARAAMVSVDSTPEKSYYTSVVNSNLEIMEGMLGLTGTPLTPSSSQNSFANTSFTGLSITAINRWDYGRYRAISRCAGGAGTCNPIAPAMHQPMLGFCPVNSEGGTIIDNTKAAANDKSWQQHMVNTSLGHIRELGFTNSAAVSNEYQKRLEEYLLDSTTNPWLIGTDIYPTISASGGSCVNSGSSSAYPQGTFITSWTDFKAAFSSTAQALNTFDHNASNTNFPCADHNHSLIPYAAGTFLNEWSVTSTDANCPGGVCTAADAQTWLVGHVPYFNNTVTGSASCGTNDYQIKWALAARPVLANDVCTINTIGSFSAPFTEPVPVSGPAVAINISFTPGQGAINLVQAQMDASDTNMPLNAGSPLASTFNSTLFSNATHSLGGRSTDSGGGTGLCTPVSITINNAPPAGTNTLQKGTVTAGVVR